MILLILAALWAGDSWEFRAGQGFVNLSTGETKAPEAFLEFGETLHAGKQLQEAVDALSVLVAAPVAPALRERGLFLRARSLFALGEPVAAYDDFNRFTREFPESGRVAAAREGMMASALERARHGEWETLLGIPIYRSARGGIDQLRKTLLGFPREEFTDDYYLKLALFLLEEGDPVAAESELTIVLENHPLSDSAPPAVLLRGRIRLDRYDGVDYDVKSLADAKRDYEKFVGDYLRYAGDPVRLRELGLDAERLKKMESEARAGIRFIVGQLAAKELAMARFYNHRGKPKAAKVYLESILRTYPDSAAAPEARRLLESLGN
jgi:outer membrane protein assembly factor BamD (BamD/ComL family)